MSARQYRIDLTGVTGILMHADNVEWADYLKKWQKDPANKQESVSGDDRSPAWTWIGGLYVEAGQVVLPADNLMTVLREGGKRCPTGKRGGTFKAQTQSGIVVNESAWPLFVSGQVIPTTGLKAMQTEKDFAKHQEFAQNLGFSLFVKRASVGQNKHVRVRPRFDNWSASGSVTVFDEMITMDVLQNIITTAGAYASIGDWRPSSPKSPGPWGKFTAVVTELK